MDDKRYQEFGKRLVNLFGGVFKAVGMYDYENDTVQNIVSQMISHINDFMDELGAGVSIAHGHNDFFVNGVLMEFSFREYQSAVWLSEQLAKIEVSEIIFLQQIERDEIALFFKELIACKQLEKKIENYSFGSIRLKKFYLVEVGEDGGEGFDINEYLMKIYGTGLVFIRDILYQIKQGESFDTLKLKKLFQNVIDHMDKIEPFLIALLHQTSFRSYLFAHLLNTAFWGIIFGRKLGLDKNSLITLAFSGVFHDIGKVRISDNIVYKERKLSPEEENILKLVPFYSIDVLINHFSQTEHDLLTFLTIYETLMGAEDNKKGTMFFPRIIAICDAYDSLTSTKPYRDAYLPQTALRMLLDDDKFDSKLVNLFLNKITFYPIGTALELSTGEVAIVYDTHSDPKKMFSPKIIPILSPNYEFYDKKQVLDLSDPLQKNKRRVVKQIDPFVYGLNPMFSFFDIKDADIK
ncbi:hypothetical protein JXR93_09095 [bacterium]|nr:hypothetical protein [bacterium]